MASKENANNLNWRRTKWVCAISLSLLLIVLGAAWIIGGKLVAPANRSVGSPPADFPAATVEIESKSGSTLAAWHLEVSGSPATVILLHPIRADRRSMLNRARMLNEKGYSTLLIDLQAHGESPGKHITIGHLEKHDVLAAVEFVRNRQPQQKIGIIAWSLGGAAALLASPDIDAIVVESVYPEIKQAIHNRVAMRLGPLHHVLAPLLLAQLKPRLGVSTGELRPIDRITAINCPVLVMGGTDDEHTTAAETQSLFDAANEPKERWLLRGAAHEDLFEYDPQTYSARVTAFLQKSLTDATDPRPTAVP